jgi:prephenate dehydrogenase
MLGKKFTIIGGSGGMGKVFGRYFKNKGFKVTLHARTEENLINVANELDVEYELSLEDSVKNADLVMISTPITSTPDMIREIAPFIKHNALVFDISSLKFSVYQEFKEIIDKYPINCVSLHPMFGPGIQEMRNYVIIVLRVGGTADYEAKVEEFITLFKSDGIIITETTPKLHDKKMALTLGVPHMFNILFLNLLKRSGYPLNELTKYTGTTFLLQKVFAESIIQREMEMFGEIQMENQEFHKILDSFEVLIKQYRKIIQNKDKNGFNKIFSEGLDYSKEDNHFEKSYEFFYDFMKVLKEKKV